MASASRPNDFMQEFSRQYEQLTQEDGWGELLARGSHSVSVGALGATAAGAGVGAAGTAAGASAPPPAFQDGDKVELHDLKAAADLNGELGKVLRYDAATQRYAVRLLYRRGPNGKAVAVKVRAAHLWKYNALQNAWREDGDAGEGEGEFDGPMSEEEIEAAADVGGGATVKSDGGGDGSGGEADAQGGGSGDPVPSENPGGKGGAGAGGSSPGAAARPLIVVNKAPKPLTIDYSRFDNLPGAETSEDEDEDGDNDAPVRIFKRGDAPGLPAPSGGGGGDGAGGGGGTKGGGGGSSVDMDAAREALELLGKIRREAEVKAAERKRWKERWGD